MKNIKISADLKTVISFGLPFVITIFLFAIMLKFGFSKISEIRLKISEAKKTETVLNQKLDLLTQVDTDVLASSTAVAIALPETNSSLSVISQLKSLAGGNGIFLSNLKTGAESVDKSGLKRIDVSFDIEASRDLIFDFLADVDNIAPIVLIDKVKINETGGVARGSIVVKSFWSELPKKLPPLNEEIKDLTAEERETLIQVTSLIQPSFIDIPATEVTSVKPDPFSF
ncbi:MAG: hypothetical protein ACHQUA_01970 [Microgenomates group bacterium]